MENVIVISHRRSGTHLTIDSIIGNFNCFQKSYFNIDTLLKTEDTTSFERRIDSQEKPSVFKTHSISNIDRFFNSCESKKEILDIFNTSRKIYVVRDGRDVMVSLFYYCRVFDKKFNKMTFSEFLRQDNVFDLHAYSGLKTVTDYWKYHVEDWINSDNVLVVSYSMFHSDFYNVLRKISKFINEPINDNVVNPVEVIKGSLDSLYTRFKKHCIPEKLKKVNHSSVYLRKGVFGDWKNEFSLADEIYFYNKCGTFNYNLIKKYIL